MQGKHLLAFSPLFYPHMGGAERTVFELYSRLIKNHGYKVTLVTLNTENAQKYEVVDGIEVYRIGKQYTNKYVKFLLLQVHFLWTYVTRLRHQKFSAFNVHYAFPLAIATLVLKYVSGFKIIVSEYHYGTGSDIISAHDNPGYINKVAGFIYKKADLVLVISQENKRYVREVSGTDKAVVIKQGTDEAFFSPVFFNEIKRTELLRGQDFVLVTTSRISPRKNIEDMIRALKIITQKGLKASLVICGTVDKGYQEYSDVLHTLVSDLSLTHNVTFLGFVSEQDLRTIYASSDLFLLTSKYEGFGIANVEAMASGVPVITYDTGAAKDFIFDGENGYVTENNPESFAARIVDTLSRPELVQTMKLKARACVEKELNWNTYASKNNQYISTIC